MKHGDKTRQKILEAGIKLWLENPLHVTARKIAVQIGCAHQNVIYYYANTEALRDAVAAFAVERGESRIIVQLCALGHESVANMSAAEKTRHFKKL